MSYILNNDKQEDFECTLALEGAELDDSTARIIVEAAGFNVMFNGSINSDGKCIVPIKNLKKLFPKETSGTMKLEVIAEDTYFSPWEDSVTIKPSKSITVETVKKTEPTKKPRMQVEVKKKILPKPTPNISELCESLKSSGFTKEVIYKNKRKSIPVLGKVIQEYYRSLDATPQKGIVKEILKQL
jgi:hypothetical protein